MELFLKYKYWFVVLAFGFLSVLGLFSPGLPPTHDGEYHVLRFQQFHKALSDGIIYPRWAPDFNNGFGIPLFNYVYPLPNYFASFLHILGFSFIDSFKLNMIMASLIGSVFFYLWSRRFWGDLGGVVSSVFYTFSPYHFLDVYVRGSVGEVWSLGLFPGLLWSYSSLIETKKSIYVLLSVIFLTLLVYSHNILALVFFSFFLLYAAFLISNVKNKIHEVKKFAMIAILGLGLAAPFWLPALIEKMFVVGLQTSLPADHYPVLYKLIYSSWGYGFSGVGGADQMSFQIGIANVSVVLISLVSLFFLKNKKNIIFFLGLFFLFLFLITPFSSWLWEIVPLASFVQFPWRLLSVLIVITSFLAGGLVQEKFYKNRYRARVFVALILILLSFGLGYGYAKAPFHHLRTDNYYLSRSNFTDGTNSPGDAFNTAWLPAVPQKTPQIIEIDKNLGDIQFLEMKSNEYKLKASLNEKSEILVNTAYFPGWSVEIDEKKGNLLNKKGKIGIEIPKGKHEIRVFLKSTKVQKTSYIIFLISVLTLTTLLIKTPVIIKK